MIYDWHEIRGNDALIAQVTEERNRLLFSLIQLRKIVPKPPNAITWEQGVEILNVVQSGCWHDWELPEINERIVSHDPHSDANFGERLI